MAAVIFDDPASAELFEEYAAECANSLLGPVNPQRAIYEALEPTGSVQCFAAYCAGILRGFAFVLLGPLPHYGRRCATVESLFVARAVRSEGLGPTLMRKMEDHARDMGCEAIFYSAPVGSRLARLLFLREEYRKTNHIFTRRLG